MVIPFSFPVFYHIAIKSHTTMQQESIFDILAGTDNCSSSLDKSSISRFFSGNRDIPNYLKTTLAQKSLNELSHIICELNLSDIDDSVCFIIWLLEKGLFDICKEDSVKLVSCLKYEHNPEMQLAIIYKSILNSKSKSIQFTEETESNISRYYSLCFQLSEREKAYISSCEILKRTNLGEYSILLLAILYHYETHKGECNNNASEGNEISYFSSEDLSEIARHIAKEANLDLFLLTDTTFISDNLIYLVNDGIFEPISKDKYVLLEHNIRILFGSKEYIKDQFISFYADNENR